MHKQYQKISVLIPAYNEVDRIEDTLTETRTVLEAMPLTWEIIVVDDGSTDGTFEKALVVEDKRIKTVQHAANRGKGQALKTAFGHSSGDVVLFLDGDLDIHPDQCGVLLDALRHSTGHAVVGSKLHPDAHIRYPLKRRLMSFSYSHIVRLLFNLPVRDTQTGIKLFEARVLNEVFHKVKLNGFAFDLELLALATRNGYTINEVPISMRFGEKRHNISPRTVISMFKDTMILFHRLNRS